MDVCKNNLKARNVHLEDLKQMTGNRSIWKKVIIDGCKAFETLLLKGALRKLNMTSVADSFKTAHVCNIWSRVSLSTDEPVNHIRTHDSKQSQVFFTRVLPQKPNGNSCHFWDKVCGSTEGVRGYVRVYEVNVNAKDSSLECTLWRRAYKNEYFLQCHRYFCAFFTGIKRWLSFIKNLVWFGLVWFGLFLWHINHCRLSNAKSIFIHINSYISNQFSIRIVFCLLSVKYQNSSISNNSV